MVQFHCDRCNHQQTVDDEFLHRKARCPECGHVGVITTGDLGSAIDPSRQQSWTIAWRGIAFVCASGLLSFGATWMWVNASVVDHHQSQPEAIGLASEDTKQGSSDQKVTAQTAATQEAEIVASSISQSTAFIDNEGGEPRDLLPTEPVDALQAIAIGPQDIKSEPTEAVAALDQPAEVQPIVVSEAAVTKVDAKSELVHDAAPHSKKTAAGETIKKQHAAHPQNNHVVDTAALPKTTGKELFEHAWTVNDPLAGKGDGLGPVFNARSCVECHFQGAVGGSGPNDHNVQAFEVLPNKNGGPLQTGVIHAASIDLQPHETKKALESLLGSPKVPFRRVGPKKSGIVEVDAIRTVFLNTPALWGNGLIDKISLRELQKLEFSHPSTGRFHQLADGSIGKFGWKAQVATLHQFVGGACAGEIGLSNSVRSQQKPAEFRDDYTSGHDLSDEQLKAMVQYVAALPAPRQVIPETAEGRKEVAAGERLFMSMGCATCHVRDVGVAHGVYSDFRLHNISSAITKVETYYVIDAVPIFVPEANSPRLSEWKTPPLWGVADTGPYWHDGSANTVREAILKHDGEASVVKAEFEMMTSDQQNRLLAFLDTLRAPEGASSSPHDTASH